MWSVRWRSLRDCVWILVVLVLLSMLVTLHLGHRLPWMKEATLTVGGQILDSGQNHLGKQRNIQRIDRQYKGDTSNVKSQNRQPFMEPNHGHELSSVDHKALDIEKQDSRPRSLVSRGTKQSQEHYRSYKEQLQTMMEFLKQVEKNTLPPSSLASTVLVEGPLSTIKQHFPLIESAFHKYKMDSTFIAWNGLSTELPEEKDKEDENWSVLMCLNTTNDANDCVVSARHSSKKDFQKKNVVPGLIISPLRACDNSYSHESSPGRWYGQDLPCAPIPRHNKREGKVNEFDRLISCQNTGGLWIVGQDHHGATIIVNHFLDCDKNRSDTNGFTKAANSLTDPVAISLPKNLFRLNGIDTFIWLVQVLVTSIFPLRAYIHPHGISYEGLSQYIEKKPHRIVSLMDLQQLISELDSDDAAFYAINTLEERIKNMLSYTERVIKWQDSMLSDCTRCFQLLEVAIGFNSSFYPFILQVGQTTYTNGLSSLSSYLVEQNVLEDLAAMLSSKLPTASQVSLALARFGLIFVSDDKLCNNASSFCLNKSQLIYLLDTRREHEASRNWRRLCPTTSDSCYFPPSPYSSNQKFSFYNWTNQNTQFIVPDKASDRFNSIYKKSTSIKNIARFHKIVTAMEVLFLQPYKSTDDIVSYDDDIISEVYNKVGKFQDHSFLMSCNNDSNTMPYLSAIHFHPHLEMQPEFSPLTTEYQAYVPYDTLVTSVKAHTKNCQALAVVDRISITNRWTNLSLGLGENVILILVMDASNNLKHWGLNAYKVKIHRKRNVHHLGKFDMDKTSHQVCYIKQDCFLRYSSSDSCGFLVSSYFPSWRLYLDHRSSLPSCSSHDIDGQWMVPCSSCYDNTSCFWKNAIWQTNGCQEKTLTTHELKRCFKDKKVLFIGDSTNRGILHYLIERINDTLEQWNKTHNIKIYSSLNDGQTTLGFAYYPQFWLSLNRRPMFEDALRKLIQRISYITNSSNTIIALGGVHWLEKHHLETLSSTLVSEGLSGAQVIVKGLGAGFHQPIGSLRHLSLRDHEKLLQKNEALLSHAISKGYHVFDTFKMTMARYKDFLQGKCVCHFQRVSEKRIPFWNRGNNKMTSPFDTKPQFHVEGEVGAAYSEMFINRICVKGYS